MHTDERITETAITEQSRAPGSTLNHKEGQQHGAIKKKKKEKPKEKIYGYENRNVQQKE